ncbi:hypothetical protein ACKVEX_14135 [Rhodocyclaceae bacterium SMB388]
MRFVKRATLESRVGFRLQRAGQTLVVTRRSGRKPEYGVLVGDWVQAWGTLEEIARRVGALREDEALARPTPPTVIKVLPKGEAG